MRKLDPSKAHDHDKVSIRMLKLSDNANFDLYIMPRNTSFPTPLEKHQRCAHT